jgi:hypothetical protein
MNHAATYNIGADTIAQKTSRKATAQAVRRIRKVDETVERCKPYTERQKPVRPGSPFANGFLRANFPPRLETKLSVEECTETAKTERDFYQSLSELAVHYDIQLTPSQGQGYPYNIYLALCDAKVKLKEKAAICDTVRMVSNGKKTYLITEERFNTGSTLYYIPVIPLYKMLQDKRRKKAAQLLLSTFSYLYHHANIPYYRQQDSFLYWHYEMMEDCVLQDWDTEDMGDCKIELAQAEYIGGQIQKKLFNPANLIYYQQRLDLFEGFDDFDEDCYKVAHEAFRLLENYPSVGIFRNAGHIQEDPDNEDFPNCIAMEKYIGFWAENTGWLAANLTENINSEFNECAEMQEPVLCRSFDGRCQKGYSLDFENRLFPLLDELCYLLNNYKT